MKQEVAFIKCGKVFNPKLPDELNPIQKPIELASVTIDTSLLKSPIVNLTYTSFTERIQTVVEIGVNPLLTLVYRLVRKNIKTGKIKILDQWIFQRELQSGTPQKAEINEPVVYKFCDELNHPDGEIFNYTVQLIRIVTVNTTFEIVNQGITAKVYTGRRLDENSSDLPILKCGKTFNPDLNRCITKNDRPVKLAEVKIDPNDIKNPCVDITYSSFITIDFFGIDVLTRLLRIKYRLTRQCNNFDTKKVLNEWDFLLDLSFEDGLEFFRFFDNSPTVLAQCDCEIPLNDSGCIYTIEIVELEMSQGVVFEIPYKSITATALKENNTRPCQ
ncbi:DUF4489 domain-containing protein [Wukongibacter baidiensis]|uniref:DUF4489 domain-containing protein n=1 Tax=Wukongibacter baidiensis TaxID=1723361 RepID=UPI003D7FEBD4